MTKTKLQLEDIAPPQDAKSAAPEIVEIRNITLKQAIELVRALATASPTPPQTE
jgi:hypothetical protein